MHWRGSMDDERRALRKRGCWRIVDTPQGVSVIKCKYVYRIKRDFTGKIKKRKSRLVIQGSGRRRAETTTRRSRLSLRPTLSDS